MGSVAFLLLLGVLQGLTEFLPVSSSGHLALLQALFGSDLTGAQNPTLVSVLLHAGTLCAVLIAYRSDARFLVSGVRALAGRPFAGRRGALEENEKTVLLLALATLPLVALKILDVAIERLFGFGILSAMETGITKNPVAVGVLLLVNGTLLFFGEKIPEKEKATPDARRALAVGVCQAFAILPGISRSGSTIAAGRLSGLSRAGALRFSFLLSVPAVLGSLCSEAPGLFASGPLPARQILAYALGAAAACCTGVLSIGFLKKVASRGAFRYFSYYCWGVGALAVLYPLLKAAGLPV